MFDTIWYYALWTLFFVIGITGFVWCFISIPPGKGVKDRHFWLVLLATVNAAIGFHLGEITHTTPIITRVIDGDTVEARFCTSCPVRSIRLADIDAPEAGTVEGAAAAVALRTLVSPGDTFALTGPTHPPSFGRIVSRVEVNGLDLGEEMIRAGHARRVR